MSGLYTNGMPELAVFLGAEGIPLDTMYTQGENPETAFVTLIRLATAVLAVGSNADRATVAGTRYYAGYGIGASTLITGVAFLVGSVGGTDSIIVELHNSTGALVATSNTSGVTLGTANTWQEIPFYDNTNAVNLPYQAAPGTYYIAIQSNGTTGKLRAYNYPQLTKTTGSATGTFGTGASITPPTTYTSGVGPVAVLYQ